jgi:DNA-binding NarL/FixJ family response regulator
MKNVITCSIVDDEPDAIDRFTSLLKQIPSIKILSADTDPDKAIKKVIELEPEIVFLDVEMPIKNGFDVVEEVRNQNFNPNFVFVTGYDKYAIQAIKKNTFDYILKPVDLDELKEAIKKHISAKIEKANFKLSNRVIKKYSLTKRETEIIELVVQGKSSKEIADLLFISKHTVDTHRRNILHKTNTENTSRLVSLIATLYK